LRKHPFLSLRAHNFERTQNKISHNPGFGIRRSGNLLTKYELTIENSDAKRELRRVLNFFKFYLEIKDKIDWGVFFRSDKIKTFRFQETLKLPSNNIQVKPGKCEILQLD